MASHKKEIKKKKGRKRKKGRKSERKGERSEIEQKERRLTNSPNLTYL